MTVCACIVFLMAMIFGVAMFLDDYSDRRRIQPMKNVRITAIRKTCYPDLMAQYENPIEHTCDVEEGMAWISVGGEQPDHFCDSAWDSMSAFVRTLAQGGGNFYDGWMKNPKSAMISCNDGFRPVSFYLETMEDEK